MRLVVGILFFLCFCNSGIIWANQLESSSMIVDLSSLSEQISITITYQVRSGPNTAQIPLRAIGNEIGNFQNVKAIISNQELPLTLNAINSKVAIGEINLGPRVSKDSLLKIVIHYQLKGKPFQAKYQTLSIPLIFVDWKPVSAAADTFSAAIKLNKEHSLKSIFPAMNWEEVNSVDHKRYSFKLQVIPAWIKFKVYQGELALISFELLIDLSVISLLLLILFFGWRQFKQS